MLEQRWTTPPVTISSGQQIREPVEVSIVIPFYNEEENIRLLPEQLMPALERMGRSFEVVAIDDGSSDGTFKLLKEWALSDARVRVINFRRNFGQTAAFSAGFDFAVGEWIITMDGDLQNDPNDIPKLLAKAEEGYDVVSGWRYDRQDHKSRTLPSQIANGLISWSTGVALHDYGCSLKVYHRDVVKHIRLYGEMHRFIPALAHGAGARVTEVAVNHRARTLGKSKYGFGRIVRVMLDLITVKFLLSYGRRTPIQIFGLIGLLSLTFGILLTGWLAFQRLFLSEPLADRPLLLLGILTIMLGVQMITTGLMAELIVRTYHESQQKPTYIVRQVVAKPSGSADSNTQARVVGDVSAR